MSHSPQCYVTFHLPWLLHIILRLFSMEYRFWSFHTQFSVRCACSTHLLFLGLIALSASEFSILCKQVDKVILCDKQSLTRTFPEELPRPRSAVQLMAVVRTKARRRASTSSRWGAEVKTVKSAVIQPGRYQMAPDGSWAKEQRLSFSFVHELRN